MRAHTRNILLMFAATTFWIRLANAQFTASATYIDADIVNATSLVDPLSETIKDVPATSFSLFINNPKREVVWVNMQLKAYVTLDADGIKKSLFLPGSDPRTITPFSVPPGGRVFRSTDAASKEFNFSFTVDGAEKQLLKNKVSDPANGGKVPSGRYEVDISMQVVKIGNPPRDTSSIPVQILPSSQIQVSVTNPTNATLLQPSDNGHEYESPFPQFQWAYDTRGVKISVYEKRYDQQSLEDAISASDPYWVVNINREASGRLSIITYPQTSIGGPGINQPEDDPTFGLPHPRDPRPLERGKTYVLVLDGIRTAFGYNIDPLRTIRLFRISDPQGEMVLSFLTTALSGGTFQDIMNLIQDQKLVLDSSHMTLNGITLTAQELQMILNQNKDKIKSIRFQD